MDAQRFRDSQVERDQIRRRRTRTIGWVAFAVIALITVGVFSIAEASQRITERAGVVHAYDELLQSVTITRAQLGFSVVLSELAEEAQVDVTNALAANKQDVDTALRRLGDTVAQFDADLGGLEPDTAAAITSFRESTLALESEFVGGRSSTQTVDAFNDAHTTLRSMLARDRASAIDRVQSADATLGRLGSLLSFVVAFVIPTVGLFLYREITRPRRELEQLEAAALQSRGRNIVAKALSDDLMTLVSAERAETESDAQLRRDIAGLAATLDVLHDQHVLEFELTSVDELLARVSTIIDEQTSGVGLLMLTGETTRKVNIDRPSVGVALDLFTIDAVERGATNIACHINELDGWVELAFSHDGVPRPASEMQRSVERSTVAERATVAAGSAGTAIAVVNDLVEASGGSLTLREEVSGGAKVILRLHSPAVASLSLDGPELAAASAD